MKIIFHKFTTACGHRIAHRKWKETKLQPGITGLGNRLGSCLVSFHFLWAILCPQAVGPRKVVQSPEKRLGSLSSSYFLPSVLSFFYRVGSELRNSIGCIHATSRESD